MQSRQHWAAPQCLDKIPRGTSQWNAEEGNVLRQSLNASAPVFALILFNLVATGFLGFERMWFFADRLTDVPTAFQPSWTNHRAQKTSSLITDYLSRRGFLKASMSVAASPAMLGAAWNNVTTKVEARQSEPKTFDQVPLTVPLPSRRRDRNQGQRFQQRY